VAATVKEVDGKRVAQLIDWFGVPRQTLDRWRHWWLSDFVDSRLWQDGRGRFS
jgi:hypothetical protein